MARNKKTDKPEDKLPDLTDKQAEFVRLLLEGKSASDAYRGAYDVSGMQTKTVWRSAAEVKANPKVRAWLAASRRAYLDRAVYTHEQYVQDILSDIEEARAAGNFGAAATLRGLLGKANAFLTDVSVRKDERTTLLEELNKLESTNPALAKTFSVYLGIRQEGEEVEEMHMLTEHKSKNS